MQILQENDFIINYIKSFNCPHHNQPIKYINYSTHVQIGKRLICSECAKDGINGYLEVEAAVNNINKDRLSQPIRNACQKLSSSINSIKTKVDQLTNQHIYFLLNAQNKEGLTKFLEETQEFYENNPNSQNTQQIVQYGKMAIQNSIKQLERFQTQMISLLTYSEFKCLNFTEIFKKVYQQTLFMDANFEDQEFFILTSISLEIHTIQGNNIKLIQTLNLPKINCMIKGQFKPLIFLGRSDGIVEVFEQLTNGQYISSHQFQAHSYNLQQKQYGVSCIITNQDNSEIITGGQDGLIKQWKFENQNYKWNFISTLTQHKNVVNSLSYNRDFNIIGSASQDRSFQLYKSQQYSYQNSFQGTKKKIINTICFVNSMNFFISKNQSRKIYLYTIINPLEIGYQIQILQKIKLNEINTDLIINVQPRYYEQLNLLIFQSNKQTYFLNCKDETVFNIIDIPKEKQNLTKGRVFRLLQFGQLSVQVVQNNSSNLISVSKFT